MHALIDALAHGDDMAIDLISIGRPINLSRIRRLCKGAPLIGRHIPSLEFPGNRALQAVKRGLNLVLFPGLVSIPVGGNGV